MFEKLFGRRVDGERLARRILDECGVDAGELTVGDVRAPLYGTFKGEWEEVTFAMSELLSSMLVDDLSVDDFTVAVCASLFLADAHRHGCDQGFFDFMFDGMIRLICANVDKADGEFRFLFFKSITFSSGTGSL
ncbi:hypothetical protein KOR42_54680 [Thalassoglobus neptunius]|uniref:Uncharacterized protein n=1 Tax=Thalassoglobus neptunius TaxID=1938619 RepID=A0A5C5UXG8_9PLAN|nr:hypothetical protein KOR42_54680 [Thalassoglobus neptunius]